MSFRTAHIVCLLGLTLVSGCITIISPTKRGGTVEVSGEQGRRVDREFRQAYITQAKEGEYDIVLVDDAALWSYKTPKNAAGPLHPVYLAPVRNVVHIHLFWRPLMGTTRNPAAVNSAIHWYVMGPDGSRDLLTYEGAGYVSLRGGDEKNTVLIRDAQIKPDTVRGGFQDLLGPARISGTLVARVNDLRVKDVLRQVEKHIKGER